MPQETNEKRYGAKKELAEHLRGIVLNLPETPGCYQYLDETGKIIYVGKAKNLKRRVSSYFNKEQQSNKTRLLVTKIRDIRYVVVKTEEDALLLENNLIKRYKPHYNVLLKDDKPTLPSLSPRNICPVFSKHGNAENAEPLITVPTATCRRCMPCWISARRSIIRGPAIRR